MRKLMLIALLLTLTGCATLMAVAENPVFQRTVQYGVIKYLSSAPDKQPQALEIVQQLQKYTEQSAELTVYDLEEMTLEAIPWDKLDPADEFLLMGMIADISELLRDQVGDGLLEADDKVKVRAFLEWIEQAVRFAA